MYFENHQTEDHHGEEHELKISLIDLVKFCQQNLVYLRGIF